MTDEQIEAAARRLCTIRGLDPDKETCGGVWGPVRRWCKFADEIRETLKKQQVEQAIRETTKSEIVPPLSPKDRWICPVCEKPGIPSVKHISCTKCADDAETRLLNRMEKALEG